MYGRNDRAEHFHQNERYWLEKPLVLAHPPRLNVSCPGGYSTVPDRSS